MIIARRLFLLVATDFLLWMPVIIIAALSLVGVHVDSVSNALIGWSTSRASR